MKFLLPVGGIEDGRFGYLVSPGTLGIAAGVSSGYEWAGDNQAYTQGFDPDKFFRWLEGMSSFRDSCLFIACPDSVGNAVETLALYRQWAWRIKDMGYPVAFVAQDGIESLSWPPEFDALFIGGTTDWKESHAAIKCIRKAQSLGKHIHIGRVNWLRRYRLFKILKGSENFTCDGTRTRYDGTSNTVKAWAGYQAQKPLITI